MEENDSNDSVVLVVVEKDRILLLKRSKTDEWMPNHWSFPGGHIMKGESPYNAAKRELKEETNLKGNPIYSGIRKTKIGKMYIYLVDEWESEIKLNEEHSEHLWIKYNNLDDLESKTPFVKEISATAIGIPLGYV